MTNLNLLNIGCGDRFHEEWTNLDIHSVHPKVKKYNLQKGIPYPNNSFDAVYHSHVLEHFSKTQALKLMEECYRVLKSGGVIRVLVPDLEGIVKAYLKELNNVLNNKNDIDSNYDWMMLELYDQTTRNEPGGEMLKYLSQREIPNEAFVFSRIGEEFRNLRSFLLNKKNYNKSKHLHKKKITFSRIIKKIKTKIPVIEYRIGNFRLSGEIHLWMYDRFSLKRLLEQIGFVEVRQTNEVDSYIPNWAKYGLDYKDRVIHAPNSLIMEAKKL